MNVRDALAWTLIHFIWQGTLVALLAGIASFLLRRARPTTRYALFCAAMAVMLIAPAGTMIGLLNTDPQVEEETFAPAPPPVAPTAAKAPAAPSAPASPAPVKHTPAYLPWLVRLWFGGVVLLSARATGGWVIAQRLKFVRTQPAAEAIQRTARKLCGRLAIRRAVRVFESSVAEVPSVVGWLRPVILLPVSAVTALSPEQIELLLAHELAHIRRYDYFVNLLQTAVETVLFYHPAVWWISEQIRAEREHCCDDLAVQACGDAVAYARTLADMEGLRSRPVQLAMAADGGSLLSRVQRLLNREGSRRHTPPVWVGALLPVAVVLIAVFSVRPQPVHAVVPEGGESGGTEMPRPARPQGFLAGLSDAGYTDVTVEEIIELKNNGVQPRFIKELMSAGLGTPKVRDLIQLQQHGVSAEFVTRLASSGMVKDFKFEHAIPLHDHGVKPDELARIRLLGFGPYDVEDLAKLRDHGVGVGTFEALKEAGVTTAKVEDAMGVQENGISVANIRSARTQGFANLTLEQIIKLRRAGVI